MPVPLQASQSAPASAALPPDEPERLGLLKSLELLDSPAEPEFDRITRLLSKLLDVPIALVSLVDGQRQWFKSRVGLDVSETPRSQSFCAHAILRTDAFIVPDTLQDDRFRDNPLVTGAPYVRFYAGIPIRTSGGLAIGTLCAIDRRPRELSTAELESLLDLADLVAKEVQLRETLIQTRQQLRRSDAVLEVTEKRFRSIFNLASVGIVLVAPDGGWIGANAALCHLLQYSADELKRLSFGELTHPDDLPAELVLRQQLIAGEIGHYQLEKRYRRKDGRWTWANVSVTKKTNAAGELEYFVGVINDIQGRKDAEQELLAFQQNLESLVEKRTEQLNGANEMLRAALDRQASAEQQVRAREAELSSVIENANDAYVSLDRAGLVTAWNRQAEHTFGWPAVEAIGLPLEELIIPEHLRAMHRAGMARYLATGKAVVLNERLELPAQRRDGTGLMVEIRIRALEVNHQTVFSAFLHDITARKKAEEQRERDARQDALTGLLNRRALEELLPKALARADRNGVTLALLFIDLDGFKAINDRYGHEAGDTLLVEIATRLTKGVRQTDSVVRLAGDEFTVLLENLNEGFTAARAIAATLLGRLSESVAIGTQSAAVGASIGIAVYRPGSGLAPAQLIATADQWMYEAKRSGKGQILPVTYEHD
jgi:diguanylate cyclase (GGDEF)-like protein/PAS domain S-box-containing protein